MKMSSSYFEVTFTDVMKAESEADALWWTLKRLRSAPSEYVVAVENQSTGEISHFEVNLTPDDQFERFKGVSLALLIALQRLWEEDREFALGLESKLGIDYSSILGTLPTTAAMDVNLKEILEGDND